MGAGQSKENHAIGSNGASELSTSEGDSSCPVPESLRVKAVYNVYNQRIDELAPAKTEILDPSNNMPAEPNQQPSPGQKKLLSTQRVVSNIPKGNTESTWVYPSPQMFFNGTCGLRRPRHLFRPDTRPHSCCSTAEGQPYTLLARLPVLSLSPCSSSTHALVGSPASQGKGRRHRRGRHGLCHPRPQQHERDHMEPCDGLGIAAPGSLLFALPAQVQGTAR